MQPEPQMYVSLIKPIDPKHDKTYKIAARVREESLSILRLHTALYGKPRTQSVFTRPAKTDQTVLDAHFVL